MTQTGISIVALNALLMRTDVRWMSTKLLGLPYEQVKALIYPRPPYKHFVIKKRDGSPRFLAEPRLELKLIQKRILAYLEKQSGTMKPCVHGFVRKRSIKTNALQHCSPKSHHLLNLDLQDFFPSITFYRVRGVLQKHPFDCSYEVATVFAHLCTLDKTLPQGAPTSPLLANLVCRTMDRDLTDLARRYRATYTRYADDITFSFNVRSAERLPPAICSVTDGRVIIGPELQDLITTKHHFSVNPNKTRLRDRYRRMEVTGLTINEFPNVRRRFIDKIRGALHAWEKHGYDSAQASWEQRVVDAPAMDYEQRPWKRQSRTGKTPALKNILWGKLLYLRMVRGKDDVLYARLAERYNAAVERERMIGPFVASGLPVEPVVRNLDGVDEAVFVLEWDGDYHSSPNVHGDMVGGQGTAFVYKELNLLVTCDHVLRTEAKVGIMDVPTDYEAVEVVNKALMLVHPRTQQKWPAKVLHRSAQYDIALIAFDLPEHPAHRYFSAMDMPIKAHASGFLIGFPNYQDWKLPNTLGDKVVNRTMPNKGMDSFTIANAGSIRPGNSGGPFTDDRFRVAGVAQRGAFHGTGDDECLCFTILDTQIAAWKASQQPSTPSVAAALLVIPSVPSHVPPAAGAPVL